MRDGLKKLPEMEAGFVEVMLCEPQKVVPEGAGWSFEVKLDGFRVLGVRDSGGKGQVISRRGNNLNRKFIYIAEALQELLPANTVLDGELVALDPEGRSSFTLIQSFRSQAEHIFYYAFDVLCIEGRDVRGLKLTERRRLLKGLVGKGEGKVRLSVVGEDAKAMLREVKRRGLEGIVAKRDDSLYESGERSGAWVKHRVNLGQEFVVGGYVPGRVGFDALVVGFYRGKELVYVSRIRAGFTEGIRREVFGRLQGLEVKTCPFVGLPQAGSSRWGGEGFTAEKMAECVWLRPKVVVQVEFLEWSGGDHLRHARYVGLREDKDAQSVVRET
jgi:DNA ligase D-like protein (predicted ligase)